MTYKVWSTFKFLPYSHYIFLHSCIMRRSLLLLPPSTFLQCFDIIIINTYIYTDRFIEYTDNDHSYYGHICAIWQSILNICIPLWDVHQTVLSGLWHTTHLISANSLEQKANVSYNQLDKIKLLNTQGKHICTQCQKKSIQWSNIFFLTQEGCHHPTLS